MALVPRLTKAALYRFLMGHLFWGTSALDLVFVFAAGTFLR